MKLKELDCSESAKKVRVYTRTGDKGMSSLFNGKRYSKADSHFEALGDIDELNAAIGLSVEFLGAADKTLSDRLREIQSRLFDLGAHVATPLSESRETHKNRTRFDEGLIEELEKWIDEMDDTLPPLRTFVLPGGGLPCTQLHFARAVCRRAERHVMPLIYNLNDVDISAGKYLNRLSDFLFVSARYAAKVCGQKEVVWQKVND